MRAVFVCGMKIDIKKKTNDGRAQVEFFKFELCFWCCVCFGFSESKAAANDERLKKDDQIFVEGIYIHTRIYTP